MIHIFVIIYKMKRAQVEKNLLTLFLWASDGALFPLSYLRDTDKRNGGDGPCQRQKMRERTKPLKCISKGLS